MDFAKTCLICLIPDIALHIGGLASDYEINHILLQLPLNKAEGAFSVFIYRIVQRNGV